MKGSLPLQVLAAQRCQKATILRGHHPPHKRNRQIGGLPLLLSKGRSTKQSSRRTRRPRRYPLLLSAGGGGE
ncbi:UNVERIFIED_CONTAM: hypothetical protein Slati_2126800 [Sesamum latifolium]|uniref:Uncharacterized protein n=1 Tax=Sesamum latifolium TaxID=2727402 RepID=A0AAW2WVS6_9LAMI